MNTHTKTTRETGRAVRLDGAGRLGRRLANGLCGLVLLCAVAPGGAGADEIPNLTGRLLIATSKISGPVFSKSVIYICEHSADGAMGLIINRAIGSGPIGSLLEQFGADGSKVEGDIRLHAGGPVDMPSAYVLHSLDYEGVNTLPVSDKIGMTADPDILRAIAEGEGPKQKLFAFGYAGWAPGQLEAEMAEESWHWADTDETFVFDQDLDSKWTRAMALVRVDL